MWVTPFHGLGPEPNGKARASWEHVYVHEFVAFWSWLCMGWDQLLWLFAALNSPQLWTAAWKHEPHKPFLLGAAFVGILPHYQERKLRQLETTSVQKLQGLRENYSRLFSLPFCVGLGNCRVSQRHFPIWWMSDSVHEFFHKQERIGLQTV